MLTIQLSPADFQTIVAIQILLRKHYSIVLSTEQIISKLLEISLNTLQNEQAGFNQNSLGYNHQKRKGYSFHAN